MRQNGLEQIKFIDSIATEPRFAFRKWLEVWVDALNNGNRDIWQAALLDVLVVTDLVDRDLDFTRFVSYATNPPKRFEIPTASVFLEDGLYVVRGSLEVYAEGLMIFEGTFEMMVHDIGTHDFKIFGIACYPHFRVSM